MRLKLNNILKIANADIELGGLTVITGVNDSGKSTIGKVLFTTLKTIRNVNQVNKLSTLDKIRNNLYAIFSILSSKGIKSSFEESFSKLSIDLLEKNKDIKDFSNTILEESEKSFLPNRNIELLKKILNEIEIAISDFYNPNILVQKEFDNISKSEFIESLNSFGKKYSLIEFYDDTIDVNDSKVILNFEDGNLAETIISGNSSVEDITYIESPVYLHILNTLRFSTFVPTDTFRKISLGLQKGYTPYHLADMAEKITSNQQTDENEELLNEICSLIDGDFKIDKKDNQLYFHKNGNKIPTVSVASGIKSFGVLLRLIETDNISPTKILVLDEPEIHLHPEWQIKFCRIIIELITKGVPIVISTHSPDFLQGLRYYAAAKGMEQEVVYYLAEEGDDGLSNLRNVTDNLNDVFSLLAAPLQSVMNVDAVRNTMK